MVALSVVVATYNRAPMVRRCLEALNHQTQPADDYEVIVVDDGSTDATAHTLARFRPSFKLTVIHQANTGQGAALNRGVASATGRYCLFTDDDIVAGPALIASHLRAQTTEEGIVGIGQIGLQLPRRTDGYTRSFADWWERHYAELESGSRAPTYMDCYTGNLSVPRDAFRKVGGFAVDLARSHDVELGYRLVKLGLAVKYLGDARAIQIYRKNGSAIARDTERAGIASVQLYARHPPMLRQIRLGRFGEAGLWETVLRRTVLFLGVPVGPLVALGHLLGEKRSPIWYQMVDRYAYWRGVRRAVTDRDTWRRLTRGPVVLMYHAFGGEEEEPSRYVVPASRFDRQMAWLRRAGYHVLPLDDLVRYLREYRLPPARSVVITIDDGYADGRSRAWPILERYGFSATFFLVAGNVGTRNCWDLTGRLRDRPLMTWADVRDLHARGAAFGSHTQTHADLRAATPEKIDAELARSRDAIERELGSPVHLVAYPYGKHDERTEHAAARAGFRGACTVRSGPNDPGTRPTALHRTEVYGTDSPMAFAVAVWFGRTPRMAAR
ncbi:MAG TPA: glycosyltransferase [Chloroflexota bacterium]|nr:glycosyltransferase [Chloroflexota bacterium]